MFDFEIMYKDTPVAHAVLDGFKLKEYVTYDVPEDQKAMLGNIDAGRVFQFLESRLIDEHRPDRDYWIRKMGHTEDVSMWGELKSLHAVDYDDFWWIRFKGEVLSWDQVRYR